MKRRQLLILTLLPSLFTACGTDVAKTGSQDTASTDTGSPDDTDDPDTGDSDTEGVHDEDTSWEESEVTQIYLEGDSISIDGPGAMVEGSLVTITVARTYSIQGTLNDGQVLVDTTDEDLVRLVLNGVDIHNSQSSPFTIAAAEDVAVFLSDGTSNVISDGSSYVFEGKDDEPNAALFSKADLVIQGSGSLLVEGNYNDGIASEDSLEILNGSIHVTAVDDGLRGKDDVTVEGGEIRVQAGGDGLKSDNEEDATRGFISIQGGILEITSDGDGLDAVTSVTIQGGVIDIDAADDAIHSNGTVSIENGEITLASADDAVHAETSLTISGGELLVTASYEGLESCQIETSGGTTHVTSSDDGLNASDGTGGGGPGGGGGTSTCLLGIHGGYLAVNANGDGLDSNGSIEMSDGIVLVNGPTDNGNGPVEAMTPVSAGGPKRGPRPCSFAGEGSPPPHR